MFKSIRLRNILSFGPEGTEVDLRPLNIMIGPNGVGKSNFMEVFGVLRALPRNLAEPFRQSGGIRQWLHKSGGVAGPSVAEVRVVTTFPSAANGLLAHAFSIESAPNGASIAAETVEDQMVGLGLAAFSPNRYYEFAAGSSTKIVADQSILAQRRDPDIYPELTYLASQYEMIRLYREWTFGRHAKPRLPQRADERNDFLAEDAANLGLVLNQIRRNAPAKKRIVDALEHLYPGILDFDVSVTEGNVQVLLQEGDVEFPATRLSDGTLRFLCLLAVLCHPTPPPLVCIEEPELGLHPDMMPEIADLLREASERCQLIVTTHSSALVDAFSREPECVLVCEKAETNSTSIQRLDAERLEGWLKDYSLGNLWTMGAIGGNRW